MKKVMVGILILIPIIILVVVALVSVIVSVNAHIAVEDLQLKYKNSEKTIYDLQIPFDEVANINIYNYVDVKIYPEKATDKTVEWQIVGDVSYTDTEYENSRNEYLSKLTALKADLERELGQGSFSTAERRNAYNIAKGKYYKDSSLIIDEMADILLEKVYPAAAFVDENGKETASNTTGKMMVSSYCRFTVRASAETVSKTLTVSVMGYDVERVTLGVSEEEDSTLGVGESMRILASYTPIDSIVNKTIWTSSDESVLSVDDNGVVTAVGVGQAKITLKASVYSSEKESALRYVEGSIDVTVESKGASSKFGTKLVTSKKNFTCEEIGVAKDEITSLEGLNISEDGILTMTASTAVLTVRGGAQLTIASCVDGDIAIKNARFYENESGYVLAVGENVLNLDLVWADMLEDEHPQTATWTSSNESVAIVDGDGNVKGLSSGRVRITVTVGGKSVSVVINVQNKLSQIQLRTSDASLAIGIARETVFASQKFVNVAVNNEKIANSTFIVVQGEPENATAARLAAFYSAYNFEIVSGGDYAHFDENVRNKLVFDSENLEGKGKQQVIVKVSAKYPKYEGMTRFTTEEVTINVVYGVAVRNIDELRQACKDQEEYANANIESEGEEFFRNETYDAVYVVKSAPYSSKLYSICLENDCSYEDVIEFTPSKYGNYIKDENGKYVKVKDNEGDYLVRNTINYDNSAKFYGDVYGNNHKVSAVTGQLDSYLVRALWNGITISNIILRANEIEHESEAEDVEGTMVFSGNVCEVSAGDHGANEYGGGVTFEYSIFENASQGVNVFNIDVNFKGCIIRNIAQAGMYVPTKMDSIDETDEATGKPIFKPYYAHIDFHNMICSNTLGTMMSITYEHYTMKTESKYRFVDGASDDALAAANEKYFIDNFYKKGINAVVRQTGFFRAYNWQDIENAKLINTGNDGIDAVLAGYFSQIVKSCPQFDNYRYHYDERDYLHMGFIVSGVDISNGIISAPTYLDLRFEEEQLNHIDVKDLDLSAASVPALLQPVLDNVSLKIYSYKNTAKITPESKYSVDIALINQIHS